MAGLRTEHDVRTREGRPLPQEAVNRPQERTPQGAQLHPAVLRAGAAAARWQVRRPAVAAPTLRAVAPAAQTLDAPDEGEGLLRQAGTIAAYAMLGAVLFHVGWWLITGG